MPTTTIGIQTQFQGTGAGAAEVALGKVGASATKAERQLASYAQTVARAQRQQGDSAGAIKTYESALSRLNSTSKEAISIERQLAATRKADLGPALPRTLESFGADALGQIKSGLLGVVGPAAAVTAGFTALTATAESFKKAFTFKAELDATNLAIQTNLEGVRDSAVVFADAAKFADKYRITQQETGEILKSSTDILRVSTSSVSDLESALLRLQSRDVSKPISEAARALRELNSGDVTSIKELFNVPAAEALRMKNEIAAGGDAVQVLNGYLDRAGVSMEVLENRSKGAAGAMNEQRIAQEQLTIAQGKIAQSAGGIFFVEALTRQYQGLANLLNGEALAGLQASGREFYVSAAGANVYFAALLAGKTAAEAQTLANQAATNATNSFADAQRNGGGGTFEFAGALNVSKDALTIDQVKKIDSAMATEALAQKQAQLDKDSRLAAQGLLGAGDQALILAQKYGIAAGQAQFLIDQQQRLSNATALADQRVGERDPSNRLTAAQNTKFAGLARARNNEIAEENKRAADKARQEADQAAKKTAADAARLADLQNQNRLIHAKTTAAKIAELERQKRTTTDPIERQQIQNQIDAEKLAGAGRVGAAQSTALRLNDIARTSGDDRLRIERENQERLRDQEEDYLLGRARDQEDFQEEYIGLLARGQRVQAAALKKDFEKDQQREAEDRAIQLRRTTRNNAEALGDQATRVGNKVESINARAGVAGPVAGGAPVGGSVLNAPAGAVAQSHGVIQIALDARIVADGKELAVVVYPTIKTLVDQDFEVELANAVPAGLNQTAVAGARP